MSIESAETDKNEGCTKDELMELVRAIKFAKPDASQRAVHKEITQLLSQKEPCLKDIQLNDIKKVWKKAVTTTSSNSHGSGADVVKLFTVGNGTVSTLANQYSQQAAKAAIENKEGETIKGEGGQRLENYVHVYLDVPADKSGSRPHQAVIHFHVNNDSDDSDNNTASSERGEIVKIQVASAPNGTKFPMLLYNVDRTARTFIHPHDDGGYDQLFNCIVKEGFGGALGVSGGSKAYFYCRRTRILTGGPDILSIDVNSLAPTQGW